MRGQPFRSSGRRAPGLGAASAPLAAPSIAFAALPAAGSLSFGLPFTFVLALAILALSVSFTLAALALTLLRAIGCSVTELTAGKAGSAAVVPSCSGRGRRLATFGLVRCQPLVVQVVRMVPPPRFDEFRLMGEPARRLKTAVTELG